ncbi:MAG: hypothetical protein ACM3ME_05145 [Chloroflexota bacterium]|jgi:hypothetical protein
MLKIKKQKNVPALKRLLLFMSIAGLFVITACNKEEEFTKESNSSTKDLDIPQESKADWIRKIYGYLDKETQFELQQARASTAKYKNIENALKDGYADINVVLPNMGYHFMKAALVDTVFDYRNPEILVYNMDSDGRYTLVAVEYAVPLDQSPEAPEGFTGDYDVWTANTGFGLWLLHAWVWFYNPDGIFNPTNPNIILP